jgi:glycine cleavage system H protein
MKRRTVLKGLAALGLVQWTKAQGQTPLGGIPSDRLYNSDHTWVIIKDGVATIGLTAHASEKLGEIVYVEYGVVGEYITKGDQIGVVESIKTTSDVYSAVTGQIIETNTKLNDSGDDMPEFINEAPYTDGWLIKVRVDQQDLSHLLDAAAYGKELAGN